MIERLNLNWKILKIKMKTPKKVIGCGIITIGLYFLSTAIIQLSKMDNLYEVISRLPGLKVRAFFGTLILIGGIIYLIVGDGKTQNIKSIKTTYRNNKKEGKK